MGQAWGGELFRVQIVCNHELWSSGVLRVIRATDAGDETGPCREQWTSMIHDDGTCATHAIVRGTYHQQNNFGL